MTRPFRQDPTAVLAFSVAAVLLAGCGGQTYERRLEETKKYFEFIEKQNVNLGRNWSGSGMTFRPPVNYDLMAGPVIKKDAKGKILEIGPDPRQPEFLGDRKLPGLVAAWKAEYPGDGQRPKANGYIYLLSNYEMYLDPDAEKEQIEKFHGYAVGELCGGLRVPTPPAANWVEEKFPRIDSYLAQKAYRSTILKPQPEIDGVKYDVSVYLQGALPVQAVLISMVPTGARAPTRNHVADAALAERMNLAMETFTNEGKKPVKAPQNPAAGGPPGGAPGGAAPTGATPAVTPGGTGF